MKRNEFDIICIGAGSGGLNIAGFMIKAGFKVLLIDKSDKSIGGDCLNFGCVPSKALIHASRLVHNAKEAQEFGIRSSGVADLKKVKEYVSSKVEHIRTHENAAYFRKKGMHVALGKGEFTGPNTVKVNNEEYVGKKIIIATGSRPRKLHIPGIEHVTYGKELFNNENIFELQKLPKELVIIGGGPIGLEIGQAFKRFGSNVTVIQSQPTLLPKEDTEISAIIHEELEKEGVKFYFNNKPTKITKNKELVVNNKKIKFDALFVSIGRELNLDLNLEKAGIETDKRGRLVLDEHLRTTNKKILACGDVAGKYQFTHAAELHAGVIISNFFSPFKKKVNYDNFSWVTFTDPEIATFGLNEMELKERGIPYRKICQEFTDDDRAITDNFTKGKLKLYISKKNKLLGGSMITKNAGEIFQELVLAQSSGLKIGSIFSKIYPYPTASRINKKIISTMFAEKLTEKTKRILKFLYR